MNIFKCFKKDEPTSTPVPEPTPVMEVVSNRIEHPQPPEYFVVKIGSKRVACIEKNKETGRWYFRPSQFPIESIYMIHMQVTHDFTQEETEMILEKVKELNNG